MARTAFSYPLFPAEIRAVAHRADVSTKSVRRYLRGESMHGSSLRRIGGALEAEGHPEHVRAPASGTTATRSEAAA